MLPLLPLLIAGAVGRIAGQAAKGSADQRNSENNQRLLASNAYNQDNLSRTNAANADARSRAEFYLTQAQGNAGIDLRRREFLQQEPNAQASQALLGNLLERLQPVSLSGLSDRVHIPTINNSMISALGPEARQAGALLAQRGLSGLQSGPSKFDALPDIQIAPYQAPAPYQRPDLQKSGMLEKILGTVGLIGSGVGAVGGAINGDMGYGPGPRGVYEPNDTNGVG